MITRQEAKQIVDWVVREIRERQFPYVTDGKVDLSKTTVGIVTGGTSVSGGQIKEGAIYDRHVNDNANIRGTKVRIATISERGVIKLADSLGTTVHTASGMGSTVSGYGASLVGVKDANGYFSGDNVEDVLAELYIATSGAEVDVDSLNGLIGDVTISGLGIITVTISGQSILIDGDGYTQSELDGGQLDSRYYTETEIGNAFVHKTDVNETVSGIKVFDQFPITPSQAPSTDYEVANKKYVDDEVATISGSGSGIGSLNTLIGNITISGTGINVVTVSGQNIIIDGQETNDVDSLNSLIGDVTISGDGTVLVSKAGQIITISGEEFDGYIKSELNGGQLDSRYYTESEVDSELATLSGVLSAEIDSDIDTLSGVLSAEIDSDISTHAALDTGVHGAGGDSLATDADIATHAGLATVHQDAPALDATLSGILSAEIDSDINTHAGVPSAHHAQTSVNAIVNAITISGGGDITISEDGQIITISGSWIAGDVDSINGLTGVVTVSGAGINIVTVSGQTIVITGTETDDVDALNSIIGDVAIEGAGLITVSENGQVITISGTPFDGYTKSELNSGQLDNRYYTETEIDTLSGNLSSEIDGDISTHVGEADPHTVYQKESEKGAANGYASLNSSTKVVEQPASITDHLEGVPTEDLATKAPTSEWAYDHENDVDIHHIQTEVNAIAPVVTISGAGAIDVTTSGTTITISGTGGGNHVDTHENGGGDEISVSGLSGLLADSQTPLAHKDSHDPNDGSDKLDTAIPVQVGSANAIGTSHSLARANHVHEREHAIYTLESHKATHENTGGDEISVEGLSGLLANDQHVLDAEAVSAMGAKADGNPLNHDRAAEWGATEHSSIGNGAPHHVKYTDANARVAAVSNAVYAGGWNGVTTIAPSKNAVYDKIEALGSGATKEFYVPVDASTLITWGDRYPIGACLSSGDKAIVSFRVPNDFTTIVTAELIVDPRVTTGSANWDIRSSYCAVGEANTTHQESDTASTYNVVDRQTFAIDISGILSNLATNDIVGIELTLSDSAHNVYVKGVHFKYS